MKPKKILCIVFSLWSAFLFSQYQQVISTAGGSFENSSGSISFTAGECIIATHTDNSNGIILTQGFQQSGLTIVKIQENNFQEFEILAYPNPTKDFLILKIEKNQGFSYKLCDMNGRIIKVGEIINAEYKLDLTSLPPSVYMLKLYRSEEEIQAFKIIKR